jgi:hypothetical protein
MTCSLCSSVGLNGGLPLINNELIIFRTNYA